LTGLEGEGFKPWIGNEYGARRVLLLGESAYSWWDEAGVRHDPSAAHSTQLVDEAIGNFEASPNFMRTVSRGLANDYAPTPVQLRATWATVAFTNYVDGSVGDGARVRPSPAMWRAAAGVWLTLLDELRPQSVVVLGKSLWASMPESHLHRTDDLQAYRMSDGSIASCWAVRHPAAGLSWRDLANVIDQARNGVSWESSN